MIKLTVAQLPNLQDILNYEQSTTILRLRKVAKNRIYISSKDVGKLDKVLSNREDVHICQIDEDRIMEKIKKQDESK